MIDPDLLPVLPDDFKDESPEILGDVRIIGLLKKSAAHPYYQNKPGEAGTLLSLLNEKAIQATRYRMTDDVRKQLDETRAILRFWSIDSLSPESIRTLLHDYAGIYLETETTDLGVEMPSVVLNHQGAPDLLFRWLNGATDGLRSCPNLVGTNPITIYTGERGQPTIANWVADYERYAVNHPSSGTIMIAEYLAKSPNIRTLTEAERGQITKLFHWFNILRFGEGPSAPIQTEDRPIRRASIPPTVTRPVVRPPTTAPLTQPSIAPMTRPVPPPVSPPAPSRASVFPRTIEPAPRPAASIQPVKPAALEAELDASLKRDAQLVEHFEDQARRMNEAGQSDESFVPVVYQAWGAKDASRAAAALINVSRLSGLTSLIDHAEFKTILNRELGPQLVQGLKAPTERISRALALPSNRSVLLKEFIKTILASAAGNEAAAARLMVHLASLVPEDQLGPEASFAYYDLKSGQFKWSRTILNIEDGTLKSEIE